MTAWDAGEVERLLIADGTLDPEPPRGVFRGNAPANGLVIRLASEIDPEPVIWLSTAPAVAAGTVQLLAGEPGEGKTTIAVDIAARASKGLLEGDFKGQPVTTLYVTAEDSPEHTLVPRLIAAGADLTMVAFVTIMVDGFEGSISLPDDVAALEARALEMGAKFVVIDPLVAHLPADVSAHKDQDVRRAMAPLARMAERTGAAVVGVIHLNKGTGGVFDRVSGSKGFTAAARNVLLTAPDPEDPDGVNRVLTHAKSNLAPLSSTLRYHVAGAQITSPDGEVIETSRIVWDGEAAHITHHQLLGRESADERGQLADAKEFLSVEIPEGTCLEAAYIFKAGGKEGHAERTLKRAKKELGIPAFKRGFGSEGVWFWGWDEQRANDPLSPKHGPLRQSLAPLGGNVPTGQQNGMAPLGAATADFAKSAKPGGIGSAGPLREMGAPIPAFDRQAEIAHRQAELDQIKRRLPGA